MCLGPGLPLELVTRMDVDLARKAMSADGDDQLVTRRCVGMMKRLHRHGLYMSPVERLCVLCEHWCIFVSNPGSIKWSAISRDREQIAKQEHNYGHNSMRIFTCCVYAFPSLASSARHGPGPSVHQNTLFAQGNVPHYLCRPVSLV
jgi:hypothetical protein